MSHCLCWTGPPILHERHCCFRPIAEEGGWDDDRDVMVCGHDETGLPALRATYGSPDPLDLIEEAR